MIAYRLLNAQTQPEFQEVPDPHAGPGQVLVKVGGSGLCHTDFTVISRDLGYWKANSVEQLLVPREWKHARRDWPLPGLESSGSRKWEKLNKAINALQLADVRH